MKSSTGRTRPPSQKVLRDARDFITTPGRWRLYVHGDPVRLYVHGDPEFERLRAGGDGATSAPEYVRAAAVAAVVAMVERAPRILVTALAGGGVGLRERPSRALERTQEYIVRRIREAIRKDGYDGLISLQERSRSRWATEPSPLPASAPRPPNWNELDELLADVDVPVSARREATNVQRELEDRQPIPELPSLPDASRAELARALKYLLAPNGRLRVKVVAQEPARFAADLGAQDRRYLSGDWTQSPRDRARTAVALAAKHLIESTDHVTRRNMQLRASTARERLLLYRERLRAEMEAAILSAGRDGLLHLCATGLGSGSWSALDAKVHAGAIAQAT